MHISLQPFILKHLGTKYRFNIPINPSKMQTDFFKIYLRRHSLSLFHLLKFIF
jgi:hypothetical protein